MVPTIHAPADQPLIALPGYRFNAEPSAGLDRLVFDGLDRRLGKSKLTYNLIVKDPRDAGFKYKEGVRRLIKKQEISGPVIIFSKAGIRVVEAEDETIETKLEYNKPYTDLKTALKDCEHRFGQGSATRWMILPPGEIKKVERALDGLGFMVGSDYVVIEIGRIVYENVLPANGYAASRTMNVSKNHGTSTMPNIL